MITSQYDAIAQYARKFLHIPVRQMLEQSFQQYVGSVTGMDLLDLACGIGNFTRGYKQRGAARVVGVEISAEMLTIARQDEAHAPLGIEYIQGDVSRLDKIGDFDIVTAAFLLHYAPTRETLYQMCQTIYAHLKPGGRFVSLTNNMFLPPECYNMCYTCGVGMQLQADRLHEGVAIKFSLFIEDDQVAFDTYYFNPATYAWALRKAGFTQIAWYPLTLAPEFIRTYGAAYWEDYFHNPTAVILECTKE